MICSARELGLGDDHAGILVLPEPDLTPGQDAAPVLHLRDDVLDIAVTPDRGYCLSIRGLARESAEAFEVGFTDPVAAPVPEPVEAGYPVRLEAAACPVFVALTVTGVQADRPSPRWMARRIQLAGMRPISLAVDITNYVMLETGQPIHAYDGDRLTGPIVVRHAETGEKLTTLDDVVRPLEPDDLLITDDSGPDRPGRSHGRRDHRTEPRHRDGGDRGGALRRHDDRPDLAPAQAVLGGLPPLRARGRPGRHLRGGSPGRRAAGRARRW